MFEGVPLIFSLSKEKLAVFFIPLSFLSSLLSLSLSKSSDHFRALISSGTHSLSHSYLSIWGRIVDYPKGWEGKVRTWTYPEHVRCIGAVVVYWALNYSGGSWYLLSLSPSLFSLNFFMLLSLPSMLPFLSPLHYILERWLFLSFTFPIISQSSFHSMSFHSLSFGISCVSVGRFFFIMIMKI